MAIVNEHTWAAPMASPPVPPDPKDRVGYSPEIWAGRLDMDDVIRPIYEETSEALGKEFKYPEN
jgi:ribonuclease Z